MPDTPSTQEKPKSPYIGKYVCYDQMDGGACWGRIKDEARVNTMKGEKEVFILEERWVRYQATADKRRFRVFYPDPENSPARSTMVVDGDGSPRAPVHGEVFLEVRKVRGDSTLRKESINLETDIVDVEEMMRRVGMDNVVREVMSADPQAGMQELVTSVGVEIVFRAVLDGKTKGIADAKSAAEIGLKAMMTDEKARAMILERMESLKKSGK